MQKLYKAHSSIFEDEYESDFILMAAYLMKEALDEGS